MKVSAAKDHSKNYMKVRPLLVRDPSCNCLSTGSISCQIHLLFVSSFDDIFFPEDIINNLFESQQENSLDPA